MKNLIRVLILPSILFIGFSAQAKATKKKVVKKTQAHQCAVYKKNAKKARQLYSINKEKAKNLNKQVKVLKKDHKELPKSAAMAKKVVGHKIHKLAAGKAKSLVTSLKYLEKHIQYVKAAKRTCASHKAKTKRVRRYRGQDIKKYLSVAAN